MMKDMRKEKDARNINQKLYEFFFVGIKVYFRKIHKPKNVNRYSASNALYSRQAITGPILRVANGASTSL